MDELDEFIEVLRGECEILIKNERMTPGIPDGWAFYSPPMYDEVESDHLRAVLNAGKLTEKAKSLCSTDEMDAAYICLVGAQAALLRSISAVGKAESKRNGQKKGGKFRNEKRRMKVVVIADELLDVDPKWRGLAAKVAVKLSSKGYELSEEKIRHILDENKTDLLNR